LQKFKAAIPALADKKFSYTDYSFNDIVQSTEARAHQIIRQAGGKVTDAQVVIPFRAPKPPKLEQWTPGIPDHKVKAAEAAWSYQGNWSEDKGAKTSQGAGNAAALKFGGVAVAVIGALTQDGGRAEVYLDGKKVGVADAYIVERTHDNVLWNVYGLRPGEHTVRFVTTAEADSRSKGKRFTLEGAVIYRKP